MSTISMFGTCQTCGLVQYLQGQPCRDCGGRVQQGGLKEPVPPAGGEPEVLAVTNRWFIDQWYAQSMDQAGWHVGVKGLAKDTPEGIELVDRAHVTRLQAEVEWLKQVAIDRKDELTKLCTERNDLQSELTKARELLKEADNFMYIMTGHDSHARLVHRYGKEWWTPVNELRGKICAVLSNQSAPADSGEV